MEPRYFSGPAEASSTARELTRFIEGDVGARRRSRRWWTTKRASCYFVPSGPLNSLPPGLLITAPPAGGSTMDADPAALRATHWLLRDKAVAVLPAAASLRVVRQMLPQAVSATPTPLLAFAAPDFATAATGVNAAAPVLPPEVRAAVRGAQKNRTVADLPALPGTKAEGEALERVLHADPNSLLLGDQASKAALFQRNDDGSLARVRVVSFSTHGLVPGDFGLTEPALVLSGDGAGHDGVLTASQAAQLRLNADLVILSACNTASPDPEHTEGVSGLVRAFFFAGAKALIVSHWRVRDDIAARFVPDRVARQQGGMSRAQAVRAASLAIRETIPA